MSRHPFQFILLLGLVSLFADATYEGARSITGPFLATLGANAAIVGFVAGLGELVGYSLRLISGVLVDRTGKYWLITFTGYFFNLVTVPLLAFATSWQWAAVLIVLERLSKAIRTPARDAMLSHAGHSVGMGKAFSIHEAMDQIGGMIGPLMIAGILFFHHSYRMGFLVLAIPAVFALIALSSACWLYPHPGELEITHLDTAIKKIPKKFWIYLIGTALIAAGYADFPLIAYHFQKAKTLSPIWIPIAYATALGFNAVTAPVLGSLYDKKGFSILITGIIIAAFFPLLAFYGNAVSNFVGVMVWGFGMNIQGSLMRAVVGEMVPRHRRGSAYGIYNTVFGIAWFIGSVILGVLYDRSIFAMVSLIMILQFSAIPWLVWVKRSSSKI